MPNYTFVSPEGEEITLSMKIAEYEDYKRLNPNMKQILSPTPLADPTRVGVTTKPADGFRDILRNIKKSHRGSNVNTY